MNWALVLIALVVCGNVHSKDNNDDDMLNDDYGADDYDDSVDQDDDVDDETPVIETRSQHFLVKQGDNQILPCNITGSTETYVQMWKKNESIIFQDKHILGAFTASKFQLVNKSLLIKNVQPEDAGSYSCSIVVPPNSPTVTHRLDVQSPAKIVFIKSDKNALEYKAGDTLQLICEALGSPEPKIKWSLKGKRLDAQGKILVIENIGHENEGNYQCLAENDVGPVDHQSISIQVSYKPIVRLEKIISNIHGDVYDVELRCQITSQPNAIVIWKKDGQEITEGFKKRVKNNVYTLGINQVGQNKFGVYSCKADNQIGSNEQHIKITNAPSQPLYDGGKDSNHGRDFNLTWSVDSLFPISEHLLEYKKKDESEWIKEKPEVVNPEEGNIYKFNYELKNLESGSYEVKVKSKNQYGWSQDSKIITLKAHKVNHGHKKHHKTENEVAQETRVEGSTSESSSSSMLPSTVLVFFVFLSLMFSTRH